MRRSIFMGALLLAGCAAPQHDALQVSQAGRIAPASAPAFADCVADGWQAGQNALSSIRIERARRADGSRVNAMAYSATVASADAYDDGRVELRVGPISGAEQRVFAACLARYSAAT